MLVVFFCVMMKILEFSSGNVIVNNNNIRNKIRNNNINRKNDIKSHQRHKRCGRGKHHSCHIVSGILSLNNHDTVTKKFIEVCKYDSHVGFIHCLRPAFHIFVILYIVLSKIFWYDSCKVSEKLEDYLTRNLFIFWPPSIVLILSLD